MDIFGVPDSAISTGEYEREINQVITYGASEYRRGLEAAAKRVEQILEVERHSTPDERIGDGSVQTLGVVLDHLDDAMAELYRLAQEGL